jgi:phosphotransferase system  glucose/maltose/N-acetylglucosamine-specific IIC component
MARADKDNTQYVFVVLLLVIVVLLLVAPPVFAGIDWLGHQYSRYMHWWGVYE